MGLPPEGREDGKAPDEPVVEEHPPAVEREEEPAPPEEETAERVISAIYFLQSNIPQL